MEEGRVADTVTGGRREWAGVWKSLESAAFVHRNRRPSVFIKAES